MIFPFGNPKCLEKKNGITLRRVFYNDHPSYYRWWSATTIITMYGALRESLGSLAPMLSSLFLLLPLLHVDDSFCSSPRITARLVDTYI